MNRCFLLALSILLSMAASASADEIKFSKVTFSNGQTMVARVICYENDEIIIRNLAGEEITEPMERVESIRFDEGENALPEPGELDKLLLAEAERVRRETLESFQQSERYKESPELQERLEIDPPAVVAMYVDTEDPNEQLKQRYVKYRCYRGAGYTGGNRINLRQPWARLEFMFGGKGARRIELDPGPPFKTKSISVELTPGEVFNLGRVVLEKDEAVATASPEEKAEESTANIKFSSGETMKAKVLGYESGEIAIRTAAGKEFSGPIDRVKSIEFGNTPYQLYKQLLAEAERVQREQEERYENSSTAAVAMYLDTEVPNDELSQGHVRLRFYIGSGFSSARIPLRTLWANRQVVVPNRAYRIELDPGPPYKTKNIPVKLREGRVTNLGRVVLEKAKADGTVSIQGLVKDATGKPVPGAIVRAGSRRVQADRNGAYKLAGFGLENVKLRASHPGFFGGGGSVSIRDTSNRQITKDLLLARPRRIRLRYTISDKNNTSFKGGNVESGTLETELPFASQIVNRSSISSESFEQFISSTDLQLNIKEGKLTIDGMRNSWLSYEKADLTKAFESITNVGQLPSKDCPPLDSGDIVLIRSKRGNARYCVKILVEELAVTTNPSPKVVADGLRRNIYEAVRRGDLKEASRHINFIMEWSDGERTIDGLLPMLIFGGEREAYVRFRSERLQRYKAADEIFTLYAIALEASLAPYAAKDSDDARRALQLIQRAVSKSQRDASLFGLVEALAEYRLGNYVRSRTIVMGLPGEYEHGQSDYVLFAPRRELLLLLLDIQQSRGDSHRKRLTAIGAMFGNIGGSLEEGGESPDFSKIGVHAEWQTCQLLYYEAEQLLSSSRDGGR